MRKNRIIKKVSILLPCALIAVGAFSALTKADCTVYGDLTTSVHYVPVLKDHAKAITSVTAGGDSVAEVKSKTKVVVFDADGNNEYGTASASGDDAMEGRSSGQATASIRGMTKAKGTHMGCNATVSNYVTAYTEWKK